MSDIKIKKVLTPKILLRTSSQLNFGEVDEGRRMSTYVYDADGIKRSNKMY